MNLFCFYFNLFFILLTFFSSTIKTLIVHAPPRSLNFEHPVPLFSLPWRRRVKRTLTKAAAEGSVSSAKDRSGEPKRRRTIVHRQRSETLPGTTVGSRSSLIPLRDSSLIAPTGSSPPFSATASLHLLQVSSSFPFFIYFKFSVLSFSLKFSM